MKLDGLWKYLAERDKDTFAFVAIFALVVTGLSVTKATPIYFILTLCLAIIGYIFMRYALLRVQLLESEHVLKRQSAGKASTMIEENATQSEKAELQKLAQPVKTKRK